MYHANSERKSHTGLDGFVNSVERWETKAELIRQNRISDLLKRNINRNHKEEMARAHSHFHCDRDEFVCMCARLIFECLLIGLDENKVQDIRKQRFAENCKYKHSDNWHEENIDKTNKGCLERSLFSFLFC